MSRSTIRALAVLALVQGLVAVAQGPSALDDRAERGRIARERSEATARHDQRRRECEQRFAVTACVEEARADHRQTMMRLRRQEALLDEAQRKERAAQRLAAIEQKRSEERTRVPVPRAQARASAPEARPPAVAAATAAERASAPAAERASTPSASGAGSAAETRSRVRFDARQREAAARRDAAEQRRIQREKNGKPLSAPLPDPAAR
jgi:colicin import membrane protein